MIRSILLKFEFLNEFRWWYEDNVWGLTHRVKNLICWFPIIWNDHWYDYAFILRLLNYKFKQMEVNFAKYGMSTKNDKVIRQLKICKVLTQRLMDDDYNDYPNDKFSLPTEKHKHTQIYMPRQDLDYLTKMMKKNLFFWWD